MVFVGLSSAGDNMALISGDMFYWFGFGEMWQEFALLQAL